jgi:heat shock protein HslJ
MKSGFTAAFAAAALLASCTTPQKAAAPSTSELYKTSWSAVSINGQDVPSGSGVTLEFGDHKVSGRAGCNSYFAAYEENGPKLTVHDVGATKMACDPARMTREATYLSILGSTVSYTRDDRGGILLAGKDGRTIAFLPNGS